jgi:hypothetical protein
MAAAGAGPRSGASAPLLLSQFQELEVISSNFPNLGCVAFSISLKST